jgi:hypothetical protein
MNAMRILNYPNSSFIWVQSSIFKAIGTNMAIILSEKKIWRNPYYRGLLIYLWENGAENPTSIAKHYGYDRRYLSVILKALITFNYLKKTPSEQGKFVLYSITETGKMFLIKNRYWINEKQNIKLLMGN